MYENRYRDGRLGALRKRLLRHMGRLLAVPAAALAFLATPAAAITYQIDLDFGGGAFLTGSIETDGTLGAFDGLGEFVDWSLDISDGVNTGSFDGSDQYLYSSVVAGDPGAWFATETSLSFDFVNLFGAEAAFAKSTGDFFPQIGFCAVDVPCPSVAAGLGPAVTMIFNLPNQDPNQATTSFGFDRALITVGEAAPVSLPGTLPLMLGALGLGWLCCRPRAARAAA